MLDEKAHHAISCPTGGGVVERHDSLRDVVAANLQKDKGFDCVRTEQVIPGAATGIDAPRLDIVATDGSGEIVSFDMTIASAVTPTAIEAGSAKKPGAAARLLEMVKRRKYNNIDVVPLAIEAHGRMGNSSLELLKKLGRQLPENQRPGHMRA